MLFSFFRKFTSGSICRAGSAPATALIAFSVFLIVIASKQTDRNANDNDNNNIFHLNPQARLVKILSQKRKDATRIQTLYPVFLSQLCGFA